MDEEQPLFKVVDRRPFNPDGTPRELSPEEKQEAERVAESLKTPVAVTSRVMTPITVASVLERAPAALFSMLCRASALCCPIKPLS